MKSNTEGNKSFRLCVDWVCIFINSLSKYALNQPSVIKIQRSNSVGEKYSIFN